MMKLNIRLIIRLSLFFITILIAIFYFFAKGVVIKVSPSFAAANAEIKLESGLGFKAGNRFIFFPGKKILQVQSPGFYSESHEIFVDSSSNTQLIKLLKKPGKVSFGFESEIDIRIFVDGKESFPISGFHIIEAGNRLVEVRNPLYLPFAEAISVNGMDQIQTFDFKLIPNSGKLNVATSPSGADTYKDEIYLGKTPLQLDLPVGLNKLIFQIDGYEDFVLLENIDLGKLKSIEPIKLSLLPGKLKVDSFPQNSRIMVDDTFKGFTPLEISLEPEISHVISVSAEGYLTQLKEISVETNSNFSMLFELEKEYGNVLIESNILSDIYIEDTLLGKTPFNGPIHAVNQTIYFKQKNYRTYATSIKPNSSFDTKVFASLMPEEEARFHESPAEYITMANQTMKLLRPDMIVMGAKRSEIGQRANETIRRVKLTKPFYLSIHEVTNLQYSLFKKNHLKPDVEENHPVVNISWDEAAIYCNWLSSQEGFNSFYKIVNGNVIGMNFDSNGYRLPTESEWSWAARSEDKKNEYLKYPWGNSMPIPKGFANFADESSVTKLSLYIPNYSDSFEKTAPVGSFTPNKKGIFDLGGNVSEYVNDFYSIQPENQEIYINYLGPKRGNSHVIKGSNWQSASNTQLRYAYRDKLSDGNEVTGFRIARWLIGISDEE